MMRSPFEQEMDYLTWARVLIAQGKTGKPADPGADPLECAAGWSGPGTLVETLALQALATRQPAARTGACVIAEALLRAEPEGYIRMFLDEGRRWLP
jgi:hypothetical protein